MPRSSGQHRRDRLPCLSFRVDQGTPTGRRAGFCDIGRVCQRVVAFEPGCPHQANQQHNDGCRQRNSRERNPRHAPKCLAAGDIRGNAEADEVGSLARRADRPLFNTSEDDGRREPGDFGGPAPDARG